MKKTALLTMLSFTDPDLRQQIEAMPEGTALIGISTTGQAIAVDLDGESPHVLVCTASGGGSTTVLRSLTAQFLHQGAHALVLDTKRISHLWAKGLSTVTHRATSPASTTHWSTSPPSWSAASTSTATWTPCPA
ncbi:hypothetical protein [Streptomyces globisporus]|uniref:hypothetical protein n=1 Tax=Streptomyces globisporus TaxID=1908 RepID=UPI00345F40C4